jgi:multidrug resistance efflux pump
MRRPFKLIGYIVALFALIVVIGLAVLVFGRMDETVEAYGVVQPARVIGVKPEIDGIVERCLVTEGQVVRTGDTLAVLQAEGAAFEVEKAEQALAGAEANLAQLKEEYGNLVKSKSFDTQSEFANLYQAKQLEDIAKEKFDRAQELYKSTLISAEQLNDAKLNYEVAAANFKALEERANMMERRYILQIGEREKEVALAKRQYELTRSSLAKTIVTAPMAGSILTARPEDLVGEKVAEGKAFLDIGDLSRTSFVAALGEEDLPRVKPGQSAKIFITAFPHRKYKTFAGRVESISSRPMAGSGSVAFETTVSIEDPTVDIGSATICLKPGLSGKVKIAVRHDVRLIRIVFGVKD